MTILNRPMFLQAGGEAGPEASMLQEAEAGAMAQGQQLGEQYAQQMMQGIDQAQSTEDLINALRGNDKPLDARRSELAGFVGQNDANETPESVLAMVQPVIMMTEEGVMDSGIGGLVQQIVGDVEMTTDSGAPTDMGMGVGSLMAAGAQEAPPPQNFRQGGEVARMNGGGDPAFFRPSEVLTQYEALLPLFQSITSADERAAEAEEQREMDKFQALMSTARGGLRLAAGDPRAGGSFASQLGAAFEPTAQEMAALGAATQKRRTDLRAEDRALRSAALQGAMGIETAEAQGRQDLAIAKAKARAAAPKNASLEYLYRGDDIKVINLADGPAAQETVDHYVSLGYTTVPPTEGKTETERGRNMFSKHYDDYVDGTLDDGKTRLINMFLTDQYGVKTEYREEYDATLGEMVTKPVQVQVALPQTVMDAVNNRRRLGASLPGITSPDATKPPPAGAAGTETVTPSEATQELQELVQVTDMSSAFGTQGAVAKFFNKLLPAVSFGGIPPLAPDLEGLQALYKSEANAAVTAAIVGLDEKSARDTRDMFRQVTPNAGQVTVSPYEALQKHEAFLAQLKDSIAAAEASAADPTVRASQTSLVKAKQKVATLRKSLGFWETATRELRISLFGGGKTVEDRLNEMGMEPTGTNIIRQMDLDVESVMSGN